MITVPVSEGAAADFKKKLKEFVCWALACPRPKKIQEPPAYFYSNGESAADQSSQQQFITQEELFTVGLTFLAAFSVFYIIDYFGQMFFWGPPGSAAPSKSKDNDETPVSPTSQVSSASTVGKEVVSPRRITMNQPVYLPRSNLPRSASVSLKPDEKASVTSQNSARKTAGALAEWKGMSENSDDSDEAMSIFGGKQETRGMFILTSREDVEFEWLGDEKEIFLTGSFVSYNLSMPMEKTKNGHYLKLKMPPGEHHYEFVIEENEK